LIKLKINLIFLFVLSVLINFYGCNYSFTGASVPSHLKTVAIPIFDDRSGAGIQNLKENITSVLVQKFTEDNTLHVVEKGNANSIIEGTIVSASEAPAQVTQSASTSGESISANRFTIRIKIVFRDLVKKKVILETTFSGFKDYSLTGNVQQSRQAAIDEAVKLVTEDILLGVVSNW